jgi:uncharacterized membrane protein
MSLSLSESTHLHWGPTGAPTRPAVGYILFGTSMVGLGVLGIIFRDFALVWQEVPAWVPARSVIACVCALTMLIGGLGLLWRRTAYAASAMLLVYLSLWLLLLRVPEVFAAPVVEGNWSGCGENAVLVAGGLAILAALSPANRGVLAARMLYGLALLPCGLAHLKYAQATADLVPTWLPAHLAWAYATGTAYIAAGVAILLRRYDRLAARLSAVMMGLFTVLIWAPMVAAAPAARFNWTALLISSALTAAAWVVADSYAIAPFQVRPR